MSTSKHIDKICCLILAVTLFLTLLFVNVGRLDVQPVSASASAMEYTSRIFDSDKVHTIDIVMDDWDSFIGNCTDEEYAACSVVIDGETYRNVAIRAKGNTSLSSVKEYGNNRYSFKIEFDHYDDALNYYGLDKLCLNNIIQDNTYMKDYLTYRLMYEFGVDAPLCSYTYITVNGEDWGLYLAVEGIEEAFLQRNYGRDYGQLYKPDSMKFGGGRGNGRDFNMDAFDPENPNPENPGSEKSDFGNSEFNNPDFRNPDFENPDFKNPDSGNPDFKNPDFESPDFENPDFERPDFENPDFESSDFENPDSEIPDFNSPDFKNPEIEKITPSNQEQTKEKAGGSFKDAMKSSDVSLIYTDDEYDSYSNIFDNAKTDISDSDKTRLIKALKKLNQSDDIENTVAMDEVIRYFVVHNFVLNFDSYTGSMIHNYYLYEKDGQLSMIPWDYNLAFGGFESKSSATELVNYPIDTPVSDGTTDSRPMLAWIFDSEEYTDLYHQYFEEFLAEYFDSGYFESLIDSVSDMIAPYVQNDPTKFCSYEEFEKGIATLRTFCLLRAKSIDGQLNGTIPSSDTEQAQDTSSLVDASELSISDMGSMENVQEPGGMHGPFPNREFPPDSEVN